MRTIRFQTVLWGTARLLGLDPTRDLTPSVASRLTQYINRNVAKAWRFEQWPEWTLTQQRWYRPFYTAGNFVEAGDELYFAPADRYYQALQPQPSASQEPATQDANGDWRENSAWWAQCAPQYRANAWTANTQFTVGNDGSGLPYQCQNPADRQFYQCLVAHTSGVTFDPAKWGRLKAFAKYVDYQQAGQDAIWEAPSVCAFKRDPRVFVHNPWPLRTTRDDRGIVFQPEAPTSVWLRFWSQPPEFTTTAWNGATAYDQGNLVYYSGDCFLSLLGNNTGNTPGTSTWGLVLFPQILAEYAQRMAYSDALRDQKQTDRALAEQQNALEALQDEADRVLAGQGIFETATVETAPSPAIE